MRNIPLLLAAAVLSAAPAFAAGPVTVTDLQVEHAAQPVGIGVTAPRFSWKIISDHPGAKQTAYEIIASPRHYGPLAGEITPLWSSGKVDSDQSVLVPWGGKPLDSRADVEWKVRIWDETGAPTEWSAPASFELGILDPAKEWKGQWITSELPRVDMMAEPLAKTHWVSGGAAANQSTGIRKIIEVPEGAKILSATCDANADGLIALYVNGNAIKQGPSSHTAPFHADFITDLKPGKNTVAIFSLAVRRPTPQDKRNAIAAHLTIDLADGQHLEAVTDGDWKATVAPEGNWYATDYDDSSWKPASDLGPYDASKVAPSADSTLGPGRYMRRDFSISKPIAKARLYYTALGTCEPAINGKRINDHLLDPGWTEYSKRTMVREQDVTNLLTQGQNAVGVVLADGWFAGRVGWAGLAQYSQISRRPLFNAQLEITYTDGTTDTIATDGSWKFGDGQIVGSDQQLGEIIDDRKPGLECTVPSFDDSQWKPAVVDSNIQVPLTPSVGPPVTVLTELKPVKINRFGDTFVVDFGQNMVGHVRITANGKPGTEITVSHGEMLQPDGTIYNENLRQAISIDKFILKGNGSETLEPQFTFHGFRYAQITGYPGDLNPDDIKAIVISSDCPTTGTFECSNPEVNRLYENTVWGMRSNYISIPTDCPQRDERMGWMGDAQVFAPTAARHADVSGFFMKWMQDVDDGQNANGSFNNVNPRARESQSYPVWADAGVVIPWTMYTTYGDPAFLSINYSNMQRYVDYEERTYTNLMPTGGVGDHLAPMGQRGGGPGRGGARQGAALPLSDGTYFTAAPAAGAGAGAARGRGRGFGRGGFGRGGRGFGGPSVTTIVDTAYFAHCAWIVSQSATILGKPDDAKKYDDLYHRICDTFTKNFVQPDGSMPAGSQTTYCLALEFNLVPDTMRASLMKHLTDDIDQRQHLSTGFVGVGYINLVLGQHDRSDEAYKLLLTDTYPSWLYEVKNGATTMWERWDGWTDTGGFQSSSMNSFNHYSFGGVGRWMYEGMEGITLDEAHPGYKQFLLQPEFSSSMSYVKGSIDSPYGKIVSNWRIDGDNLIYDVTVPPNSSAIMTLPVSAANLKSSGDPTGKIEEKDGSVSVPLPAGTYQFTMPKTVAK